MHTKTEPLLVSVQHASELLALSERYVRQLISDGDIKSVKIKGARRILYSDLRAFVDKQGRRQ